MIVRLAAAGLALIVAAPAFAQGTAPAIDAATAARLRRSERQPDVDLRRTGRRHRIEDRRATRQRAGRRQRRDDRKRSRTRQRPISAICCARLPRCERRAGVGTRHQHHDTRRDVDAVDLAAGAGRRPKRVSRFLRHGDVGPRADQSRRNPANRGHSRSGIGDLGRQRHERRRQRDHQIAARAGQAGQRHVADDRRRQLQPKRDRARHGRRVALLCQWIARAKRSTSTGRTSCRRGYFTQDPLPRPVGTIPNIFNTPYPSFKNEGTKQPKFDARVDYDMASNGGTVTVAGGVAGTQGLIHTGIGPFDISSDSRLSYFMTRYQKGGRAHRLLHEPAERQRVEPAARSASTASRCRSTSTPRLSTSKRTMCARSAPRTC